jgi:hypothetical protein
MMMKLALEYILVVFVAATGVIQASAAFNGLRGLLFFKYKVITYIFSCVCVLPVLFFFFTWNYRNATGIIEGAQQAGLVCLAMFLAIIFTLIFSSLLNHKSLYNNAVRTQGIEALKDVTFFIALQNLARRRHSVRHKYI